MLNRQICIIDKTLSCLDDLPHDRSSFLRFLNLLIKMDPGAIELSRRMYKLLSPLPKYPSYILRDENIRHEIIIDDANNIDTVPPHGGMACNARSSYTADRQKIRIIGLGNALRGDYRQTFARLKKLFRGDIEFCPTDNFHCATALAAEWAISGAGNNIVTSFCGIGNFAPTEELVMILRMNGLRDANKCYDFFPEMADLFRKITRKNIRRNKPVIGKQIFHVESGVHADGILKQPKCYEPFPPEIVGLSRKIVLGKQSGVASIRAKLSELNLQCADDKISHILNRVKAKGAEKKGIVASREFVKIVKEART
jgi:homocitrate synthase NifV